MAIPSTSLNSTTLNITSAPVSLTDTETKSIQNQITGKQQNLNRLSSDSEMSAEEKAKERQEIQKQIAELNRKLRMLRMEKKEEAKESEKEQEQKTALKDERTEEVTEDESAKGIEKQQEKPNSLPQNIQKMLESGTLLQKERIQQTTDHKKELTEEILETEIKLDELYGTDTSAKREQLSSLMKKDFFDYEIDEKEDSQPLLGKNSKTKIIIKEGK